MKILVVEDERLISLVLSRMIQGLGHSILACVPSAAGAIEALEGEKADLVLMDIRLEGDLDGIEAARILKDRWAIPLVFTSAYTDPETLARAGATGPLGFLPKPISESGLKALLDGFSV